MGDYKKNPKNPNQVKISNKVRKRFGQAEHVTRMEAGSGMSAPIGKMTTLAAAFTRKFYAGRRGKD